MKTNWLALFSAVLIFASLLLPWISATFYQLNGSFPNYAKDFSLNAGVSIHYFGFIGYANGITQTMLFPYWFNWVCTAMLLVAGLVVARASFSNTKTSRRLLVLAGVLAILCSPLYYVTFMTTMLNLPIQSNNMLFNIFSPNDFALSNVIDNLHTQTGLSLYWLSAASGVLAIVSTKIFKGKEPVAE